MTARFEPPYCGGVAFVLRVFRAQTWRELAYLLLGGFVAILSFGLLLAGVIAVDVLLITLIGVAVFVAPEREYSR